MTSEPRAPAPDPTSRLGLRRGRRHVRPPGAGARSRRAAPGASCPFLVSALQPSPRPPRPTGWTLVPRRAQASCSWREKRALSGGRANTALARQPSAWLRGARSQPPGCLGLGQPPQWGGRTPRPPDCCPFSFKLGQENRPAWGSWLCPCPSEYGAVLMVTDLFTNFPEPSFPKPFQLFDSHRELFCLIFSPHPRLSFHFSHYPASSMPRVYSRCPQ